MRGIMEFDKSLLTELIGKKVVIKTHYGIGTKNDMAVGDYKGILLEFDGNFAKIEYDVKTFVEGSTRTTTSILLINLIYMISVEQYVEKPE